MKKIETETTTQSNVMCSVCGQYDEMCKFCKRYFDDEEKIYCINEGDYHYHKKCKATPKGAK